MRGRNVMGVKRKADVRVVSVLLTSILLLLVGIALYRARGIYTSDTSSYVKVNEIYDDSAGAFGADNVNTLLRYITGDADITIETATDTLNTMATANTTSADIATKAVLDKANGDDVIVTFGGLDWQVVYLSKDTDGNNILTLWLSSSQQDAFSGRTSTEGAYYGFINNSLYSDWSADFVSNSLGSTNYPPSVYGMSYIRAVTLNNGGSYATSTSAVSSASQSRDNVFARFTIPSYHSQPNSVTSYLVVPDKMEWQRDQSAAEILGGGISISKRFDIYSKHWFIY